MDPARKFLFTLPPMLCRSCSSTLHCHSRHLLCNPLCLIQFSPVPSEKVEVRMPIPDVPIAHSPMSWNGSGHLRCVLHCTMKLMQRNRPIRGDLSPSLLSEGPSFLIEGCWHMVTQLTQQTLSSRIFPNRRLFGQGCAGYQNIKPGLQNLVGLTGLLLLQESMAPALPVRRSPTSWLPDVSTEATS